MPEEPGIAEYWLLENPQTPALMLFIAAVVLIVLWRRRRRMSLLIVSIALLGVGAGNVILANAVTTEREQLIARSKHLVELAEAGDMAGLRGMFDPEAALHVREGKPCYGLERMLGRFEAAWRQHPIRTQVGKVTGAEARGDGTGATYIEVSTTFDEPVYGITSLPTEWRIDWKKTPDGQWIIRKLTWTEINWRQPDCP